jgi:hypothetical protein
MGGGGGDKGGGDENGIDKYQLGVRDERGKRGMAPRTWHVLALPGLVNVQVGHAFSSDDDEEEVGELLFALSF